MVKKIKVEFTAQNLSNNAGIYPIMQFMDKIGVKEILNAHLNPKGYYNQKFTFNQIFYSIIGGLISGANRIKKIETFTKDMLIKKALKLKSSISDSTIKNRISAMTMKEGYAVTELNGALSRKIHKNIKTSIEIVDCDSTVKTVYGEQEGARKGYNTHKRGAKSYHPLLAFLDSTKECILTYFRPGDAYTANNGSEFIRHLFGILYKGWNRLIFRMDSGFYDGNIFDAIEEIKNAEYIVKVKIKNPEKLLGNRKWIKISQKEGWEQTEFEYQAQGWKKARRFIAVRLLIKNENEGRLFTETTYEYFCYCTNMELTAAEGHAFYGNRGTCENWIEAVKNQMFAGAMLTQEFWVNDFLWNCSIIAYNISVWSRYLVDKNIHKEEPQTFREWFINIAGKVVEHGRKINLLLSKNFYCRNKWEKFYINLTKVSI